MAKALIAKPCVVCRDPVESLLSGEVMCNKCIDFRLAPPSGKPVVKPCPMCDTDMPVLRDLCDDCIDVLKDSSILKNRRNIDRLKLFELHIHEPILIAPNMSSQPKSAVMYVLGKSDTSTVKSILDWLIDESGDWSKHVQISSVKELEGPFDHGHVIYYGETTK